MKHRVFRDHAGRIHVVRKTDEEVLESWKYLCGFVFGTTFFSAVLVIVSGIFA